MKKILIGFALLTLSITFNACDNLDLAPEDYYASESFWKTLLKLTGQWLDYTNN